MTNPPYPQQPPRYPYPGAPGTAQPQRPAPQGTPQRGNPAGLIAVILIAVVLILQLVTAIGGATLIGSPDMDYRLYGTFTAVMAVVQGLIAVAAIVLGSIGLAARGRPKGLAGIGLGGGAVVVFSILASQLTSVLLSAFRG